MIRRSFLKWAAAAVIGLATVPALAVPLHRRHVSKTTPAAAVHRTSTAAKHTTVRKSVKPAVHRSTRTAHKTTLARHTARKSTARPAVRHTAVKHTPKRHSSSTTIAAMHRPTSKITTHKVSSKSVKTPRTSSSTPAKTSTLPLL